MEPASELEPFEWEDADVSRLKLDEEEEEEEEYVAPKAPAWQGEAADDGEDDHLLMPALLLDLSALADQAGEDDVSRVREKTLAALAGDFFGRAGELLGAGVCWHVPVRTCDSERAMHEELRPGTILTVIEYPAQVDGAPIESLWQIVSRETPWEVVDEMKRHVAATARSLKQMAEICVEIETLAEEENVVACRVLEAQEDLERLQHTRTELLETMHSSHDHATTPLSADEVSEMLQRIDEMNEKVQRQEREHEEAVAEQQGEGAAPEGERSTLDLLLDLIFERYPPPAAFTRRRGGAGWAQHATEKAEARRTLHAMWLAWFGRAPAASKLALKHAPPPIPELPTPEDVIGPCREGRPPRLKVPGAPPFGGPRD